MEPLPLQCCFEKAILQKDLSGLAPGVESGDLSLSVPKRVQKYFIQPSTFQNTRVQTLNC